MTVTINDAYPREFCALQEVLTRYFQGCDRGDVAQIRSCFADDARVTHPGRDTVVGGDAVIEAIFRPAFAYLKNADALCRMHFMGNFRVERLDGDVAETETYVIAALLAKEASGETADVKSLRYMDRFRRINGQWRVSERRMTQDWSAKLPASFAMAFASRVGKL